MKIRQAEEKAQKISKVTQEIQKLKKNNIIVPSSSKFYPSNPSSHHLPPNEEEDCGLETIARWMIHGQANTERSPYSNMHTVNQGQDGRRSLMAHSPTSQTTLSSNKKHHPMKPYELIN